MSMGRPPGISAGCTGKPAGISGRRTGKSTGGMVELGGRLPMRIAMACSGIVRCTPTSIACAVGDLELRAGLQYSICAATPWL